MSHRLTDQIGPWIEAAIEKHSMGDRIVWETNPQGTQNGVGLGLILFMPGALLNSVINSLTVMPNPLALTEEVIDTIVGEMVEALRAERSKHLAQANGAGNGDAAGLIQP